MEQELSLQLTNRRKLSSWTPNSSYQSFPGREIGEESCSVLQSIMTCAKYSQTGLEYISRVRFSKSFHHCHDQLLYLTLLRDEPCSRCRPQPAKLLQKASDQTDTAAFPIRPSSCYPYSASTRDFRTHPPRSDGPTIACKGPSNVESPVVCCPEKLQC